MKMFNKILSIFKNLYGAFLIATIILVLLQFYENILWLNTIVIIYAYLFIYYVSKFILGGGSGIANSQLLNIPILHKGWAFSLFILIVILSTYVSNYVNELIANIIASIVSSILGQSNITVTQGITSVVALAVLYLNFKSLFYPKK